MQLGPDFKEIFILPSTYCFENILRESVAIKYFTGKTAI